MASVHFYSAADLPIHLLWQVRSFVRMRWTFLFGPTDRLRRGLWWMEGLSPEHAVLVENDVLISHAAIVRKVIEHAGETYAVLGLNGVFTFPDFRREGYGRQLVTAATQRIALESDADIGVLFCRAELMPLYASAGWEHAQHAITRVGAAGNPRQVETDQASSERRMMLFVSEKGRRARQSFWDHPLYFGESEW